MLGALRGAKKQETVFKLRRQIDVQRLPPEGAPEPPPSDSELLIRFRASVPTSTHTCVFSKSHSTDLLDEQVLDSTM